MKRALLLLLLLGVASGPASAVIDPFYRNRMESGVRAFEQGNWEQAARQLRIACFGHLNEPVALVEGLMRLAVVEVTLGDEDAFRRIFSRLVELEERFSAYSAARVPLSVRQQFEGLAARLAPAGSLRATAGFRSIAERADLQRLGSMLPEQRRTELESRLRAEPQRAEWLIEMSKLEIEVRRPQTALDWLDRLPAAAAEMPPATCLRQQAASQSGSCSRMDLDRPFCENVPVSVVEFRLQCLVDAGNWIEASAAIGGLDPELRAKRRVARLARRVNKNIGEPADGADAIAAAPPTVTLSPPTEAAEATVPAPLPQDTAGPEHMAAPADVRELEQLRRRLAVSETGDELTALMSEAEELADRHQNSRPARLLAAEIAYLQSDWAQAIKHFRRAGELRTDETRLAFYLAVALYESGQAAAAAEVLRPVASRLERTRFVDAYLDRILGPGI